MDFVGCFREGGGWILLFDDAISHTVVMRKYNAWGIDVLLQIISQDQNLTLIVTDESVGTYFCHAEVEGYAPVTSNPAEILITGRPEITSSQDQMGVVGDNVHIKCTAVAIPQAQRVVWKYHGHTIQEGTIFVSPSPFLCKI